MISLFFNGHNEGIKEDVVIQDTVEIYFQFPGVSHTFSRYPDNIIMGLAKLGGLFAALKVSLVLLAINKSLFEKKMSKTSYSSSRFITKCIQINFALFPSFSCLDLCQLVLIMPPNTLPGIAYKVMFIKMSLLICQLLELK